MLLIYVVIASEVSFSLFWFHTKFRIWYCFIFKIFATIEICHFRQHCLMCYSRIKCRIYHIGRKMWFVIWDMFNVILWIWIWIVNGRKHMAKSNMYVYDTLLNYKWCVWKQMHSIFNNISTKQRVSQLQVIKIIRILHRLQFGVHSAAVQNNVIMWDKWNHGKKWTNAWIPHEMFEELAGMKISSTNRN